MRGAGQPQPTRQQVNPTNSDEFQKGYEQLAKRKWTTDLAQIVDLYFELMNILATIAKSYVGSGRYKKPDSDRIHFIKEIALPGLICGRDSPSKYDLLILRYPLAKSLSALQTKAVVAWAASKTARSDTVATESALATMMHQTTMLDFVARQPGASAVGGRTPVPPGAAAEYKIDFGSYSGLTLRQAVAKNSNYVTWLCDTYVWRFPQSLNLFYALHAYRDVYTETNTIIPSRAMNPFISYLKTILPCVFGDLEEEVDDEEAGGGEEDEGEDEPAANGNKQRAPRRANQTNNVTPASINHFNNTIKPSRSSNQSRMPQLYHFNPLCQPAHEEQPGDSWDVESDALPPV
jgi:hypothetical protein